MTRVAPVVPAESDILCENCGYTLNGLPADGNCPECGAAITRSTTGDQRIPPAYERKDAKRWPAFISTSATVLFRPTHFFKTSTTRAITNVDRSFARAHWAIAALLFGATAYVHSSWYLSVMVGWRSSRSFMPLIGIALALATYLILNWTTRLAGKLTAWEAAYRGLRLPYRSVLRALHYHAAHYVPVALIAFLTVSGYQRFFAESVQSATTYLYVLCAEVIIGAAYLFHTYWIAMRNMMYANR